MLTTQAPGSFLLPARFLPIIGRFCATVSREHVIIPGDSEPSSHIDEARLPTVGDAEADATSVGPAPQVLLGGLQASKLCRMTGLCSRTKVKIVNTNMRCPACLMEHLSGKESSLTFFPAVDVEQTVRLYHHRSGAGSNDPVTVPGDSTSAPWRSTPIAMWREPFLQTPWHTSSSSPGAASRPEAATWLPRTLGVNALLQRAASSHRSPFPSASPPASAKDATTLSAAGAASSGAAGSRFLSSLPMQSPPAGASARVAPIAGALTGNSAGADPAVAQPHDVSAAALLRAWLRRVDGRTKGISRKFILRTFNKRVVRQMARRATIGFPIIGFFFVSRLLFKDYARVRAEVAAGRRAVAGLFSVALACDAVDVVCQACIIAGLAHSNFGLGPGVAAGLLAAADVGSVAMAVLSFSAGVAGELLTVLREEREAKTVSEAEVKAVAGSPTGQLETAAAGAAGDWGAGGAGKGHSGGGVGRRNLGDQRPSA